jgi:hypothetical protein
MARYTQHQRDVAYRIYVTDCLRQISENTAKIGGGGFITKRFADIVDPKPQAVKSAAEIIADITTRAEIEVV